MQYKVLGIENVDYENKQGRNIQGTKLHLAYEKEDVEGVCVETVFLGKNKECYASIGDTIRVIYNRFGSVDSIEVLA